MTVTFAEKLARMPHYEPGIPLEDARAAAEDGEAVKLASNESPFGPHPEVVKAIQGAAAGVNRYPDPGARRLRQAIADRHDLDPGRVTLANGSCEILLAAAEALCEPGSEIVYAWPSFSIYPYLPALSGARPITVPLDKNDKHDLGAMLGEITAATQLLVVCNPNNPTGTCLPATEIADFCDQVPAHVTVILDEAYIEFATLDDPDTTVDRLLGRPNVVLLRTFSKVYGLAGLRVGYALCSPEFRSAVDAVRQPYSVNSIAQVAATEAIRHQDDVAGRVVNNAAERMFTEQGIAQLGLKMADSHANFTWIELGELDEEEVVEGLARAGVAVRAGTPLGGPGHLRVTYGTRAENEKFIASLASVLQTLK
ncbi:MAG: histidinol-phosphate transaminase [Solirubrobacterales bacterium]